MTDAGRRLTLRRIAATPEATYGVLLRPDGTPFCVTLEREYDGGSNRASTPTTPGACIPADSYLCGAVVSPKFGATYEVLSVPDRSHILFHAGNLADDSRGCILLGESFNPISGHDGITSSREAMREFFAITKGWGTFTLVIENRFL